MTYVKHFKKKKKKYPFVFIVAIALIAGFLIYDYYGREQWEKENVIDAFEEKFPSRCENGEWVEFPILADFEQYEKFVGNEKIKYEEQKSIFSSADGEKIFLVDEKYSLSFFMDRETRIEGRKIKDNEIYVEKIKCVGAEADKKTVGERKKLMDYISGNINSLALEKALKNDWVVGTFYFVNDSDLYVQYESEGSFAEEAPYDSRLWLMRVSKMDRSIPVIETLAYIQEDAEDPEKNVIKQGEDLYANSKNLTIYEFDEDANGWVLQ